MTVETTMTTKTQECGKPQPHEPHTWRRISEGPYQCPGHDRPFTPEARPYDCEVGMADLCPVHKAAPKLLAALKNIEQQTGERWVREAARAAIEEVTP
jgi:hypothetical protein